MDKLKELRIKNHLSQRQVAQYLEITPQSYFNYENGKFEPSISGLKKLATLYNISIDNLVGFNDNVTLSRTQVELIDEIKHISDEKCKQLKSYLDGLRDKN